MRTSHETSAKTDHAALASAVITPLTAEDICWELRPVEPSFDGEDILTEALVEGISYRNLAQQAIHALHELRVAYDALLARHRRLAEEYRALRKCLLREGRVAA